MAFIAKFGISKAIIVISPVRAAASTLKTSVSSREINNAEVVMAKITSWFIRRWSAHPVASDTVPYQADGAHLLETINAIGGLYGIEFIHHDGA